MAIADQKKPDPSAPSYAYRVMAPKWQMIDDLIGGTSTMRNAGQTYLPQHPAESNPGYANRLNSTILYNVIELTRDSLVGRVFKEELRINDDVPDQISTFTSNIDLQNNDVSNFCAGWFSDGVTKGFSHVLIDMPSISPDERVNRTLADDRKQNNRPFWSLVKPENLLFAYFEKQYGVDVCAEIRIMEMECHVDPVTLAEVWETHIRVIKIGGIWEVWKNKNEGKANRKPEWEITEQGTYDLPIIPLVTFYSGKKQDNMLAKPPLEDLAYMNVRHWQSTSDQINVLTVARFPMLAASGTQLEAGKGAITIGPRALLTMRDPNGRFYYVEHSGKAIAAGQTELDGLVDQMSAYGSEFLRRQIAGRTAFERAADGNEATSPLKRMAIDFKGAVEQALKITAMWVKIDPALAGTVTINTNFTEESSESTGIEALSKARDRMDISRETFINEMKRRGEIDSTIDAVQEIERIKAESADGPIKSSFVVTRESITAVADNELLGAAPPKPAAPVAGTKPSAGSKSKT